MIKGGVKSDICIIQINIYYCLISYESSISSFANDICSLLLKLLKYKYNNFWINKNLYKRLFSTDISIYIDIKR